ncbi:hypothetical protein [Pseudomonas sp. S2_H01]
MDFDAVNTSAPGYADYLIKHFGATRDDLYFFRYPKVILRAMEAVSHGAIVGYLACALERPTTMTGLMFGDRRRAFPDGLPIRAPAVSNCFLCNGFRVVQVKTGGLYVIAHWLFENGEIGPFYSLQ